MSFFNEVGGDSVRVFLGVGSNLQEREDALDLAVERLARHPYIWIRNCSSLYETEPWGVKDQAHFLNMAVEIDTKLGASELLAVCKQIEADLGRKNGTRWGPRTIDLDILLYGNATIQTLELEIPHPKLSERRFVLLPMAEIAKDVTVPGMDQKIEILLEQCPDSGKVCFYRKAKGVSG